MCHGRDLPRTGRNKVSPRPYGECMDSTTPAEISARISALEDLVFNLYQQLNLTMPSPGQSIADSLPEEVATLAREGQRDAAIRRALELMGLSVRDATLRVDGYLRSLGR